MMSSAHYELRREARWRLLVLPQSWSNALWSEVQKLLVDEAPARHPLTKRFTYHGENGGKKLYLKIYPESDTLGALKDLLRSSKAFRSLKQGKNLLREGFHVPYAVAAGEERMLGVLKRAFLLTQAIEGFPLPTFLRDHFSPPLEPARLRKKREYLKKLALEIRRLHQSGFVHGDLIPANILVQRRENRVEFFLIDNDRTWRYPAWLPQSFWKRNLIQLNRFVLPGISLQDRMRFLRSYLGVGRLGKRKAPLVTWLEDKTRTRRFECDGIKTPVSFRELMRWGGPFSKNV